MMTNKLFRNIKFKVAFILISFISMHTGWLLPCPKYCFPLALDSSRCEHSEMRRPSVLKGMTFCSALGVIILIIVDNNTFIHINIKVTLKEIFLNMIFVIMYVMFALSKETFSANPTQSL